MLTSLHLITIKVSKRSFSRCCYVMPHASNHPRVLVKNADYWAQLQTNYLSLSSLRNRRWDKDSIAGSWFERWSQETLIRESEEVRHGMEGSQYKVYSHASYYCGRLELNPIGNFGNNIVHSSQNFAAKEERELRCLDTNSPQSLIEAALGWC